MKEETKNMIKNSTTLKLLMVGLIILILMIPMGMITSIIFEREGLNIQAKQEVRNKWALDQRLSGPIITIPYTKEHVSADETVFTSDHLFYLLPEEQSVIGSVDPDQLNRGIYSIVVYQSDITVTGSFDLSIVTASIPSMSRIKWDEAFMTIGISDLRGIDNEFEIEIDDELFEANSGSKLGHLIKSGITIDLPDYSKGTTESLNYSFDLSLKGSSNLSFVPIGESNDVRLTSTWADPKFDGDILPDEREVTEEGFKAVWKTIALNRNFPQYWSDGEIASLDFTFGVDLLLPIDDYKKSIRSAKYSVLFLALTFLIFLITEIKNGKRVHPFQYLLVGLALSLFYILLISISEHSNFNIAYLIAASAVIILISLYTYSVFKDKKIGGLIFITLTLLYSFIFVLLKMASFALLFGAIGLLLILAATMYFSRNIDWYNTSISLSK